MLSGEEPSPERAPGSETYPNTERRAEAISISPVNKVFFTGAASWPLRVSVQLTNQFFSREFVTA
jgi:hypothetical protein